MKRLAAIILLAVILCGCEGSNEQMDRVLALRAKLLQGKGCSFDAVITADYGDQIHKFTLACQADEKGTVTFSVSAPENIAGITGKIDGEGGKLTFDDQMLVFPLLADDQLSPVSSPWVLVKTLRGGYITACGKDGDYLLTTIDDSYADDALQLDIWLNGDHNPIRAEILWKNRRFLSMEVQNFRIL